MARKKTPDASTIPPGVEPESSAVQPPMNGGKPRGQSKPAEPKPRVRRKRAEADAAGALDAAAEEVRMVTQDFAEAKHALESLRRHTHSAALQLAALRHQAEALNQEMDQTRREASQEAVRLCELRQEGQTVREALREATGDLAELIREMGEARGQLAELRREADGASRTADALRTRSLEAATEIAAAAAAVRQTLEQAAGDAVEYARVSALLGAEGDIATERTVPASPSPVHEHIHLGVTMAVDSGTVLEVAPDSPAARAGVTTGDVIASANGEAVRNGEDLRAIVSRLSPGSEVLLHLERSGTRVELRAHLSDAAGASSGA
jgi:hypothetical protein